LIFLSPQASLVIPIPRKRERNLLLIFNGGRADGDRYILWLDIAITNWHDSEEKGNNGLKPRNAMAACNQDSSVPGEISCHLWSCVGNQGSSCTRSRNSRGIPEEAKTPPRTPAREFPLIGADSGGVEAFEAIFHLFNCQILKTNKSACIKKNKILLIACIKA
jgi:hypothetical protein